MTKKLSTWVGWAIIVTSVLILGLPLTLHVMHLGLQIIKLVVEAVCFGVIFAAGVWLVRR